MNSALITIKNLSKTYSTGPIFYNALDNISLEIAQGEFLCIMGPSGSGKSTLLNIIGGVDRATSGQIIVDNLDLAHIDKNELAKYRQSTVGIIFQNFNLLPVFTALENVNLGLVIKGVDSKDGRDKSIEILKWVGLTDRLNNKPSELSGGEQQRVAIARALVKEPKIILADEPTGNLDTKTGEQIVYLLKSLKDAGKTVVVVTHNPEVAKKADRIINLRDGKLVT